ncbi:MAG: hypothetical protein GY850_46745 [bacterium]|nr:hypothetical protein [bacterium]
MSAERRGAICKPGSNHGKIPVIRRELEVKAIFLPKGNKIRSYFMLHARLLKAPQVTHYI